MVSEPTVAPLNDEEIETMRTLIRNYDRYPVTLEMRRKGDMRDNYATERRVIATIDALLERERKLREYVVHMPGCASVIAARESAYAKCTCELAELLVAKEGA